MHNIAEYVLAEASKSNVDKRQVGCIITEVINDKETIVARGHNDEMYHAEARACESMCADALDFNVYRKAYVSHPPCPACAQDLAEYNVTDVVVIEAFQKFDGDKLRYDLIDGNFLQYTYYVPRSTPASNDIRQSLWRYQADPTGNVNWLRYAINAALIQYSSFAHFEEALARVLTFGARKYKANNWKKCEDTGRYLAAAHRHLIAKDSGEACDPETGFDHLDHAITNLMFLYVLGYSNE